MTFSIFSILLFSSSFAYSISSSWDGGGDGTSWSDPLNWNPNNVPSIGDDITIDCNCTITASVNIVIDGSLSIGAGTTIDMGNNELEVGQSNNNASISNNGIINNCLKVKAKGTGIANQGPFLINNGTITAIKFEVGNNNGGGIVTNNAAAIINVTNTVPSGPGGIDESLHVDGNLCNSGTINVSLGATFHGAILKCGGILNATTIEFEEGKGAGGATGGACDIQSQSFGDGDGCSGATANSLIYYVIGGVGGGPNGDDSYTYQQLLDEFTAIDTNPNPQFMVDPVLVTSCGESAVGDTEPPTISDRPNDTTVYALDIECNLVVNWTTPIIVDNIGVQSVTVTHNPGDVFLVGTTSVTYTATDAAANSTNASFKIMVLDTISPTISNLPSDINQNSDAGACGAIVSWALPTATDNCASTGSSSHRPGDFFNVGTTTVTYTSTDIHGNSTVLSFDVTINDNIPPVIENLPTDILQNTDVRVCGANVTWALPTATDNCAATLSSSHHPGDFFNVGTTTVTYTAADVHGNSTVVTFDVTIHDNIPPVINNIPANITQNTDAGVCGAMVNWTPPTATDNCTASLSSSHHPGDFFNVGTTTVSYTALDIHGNSTVLIFDVMINDNITPVINNIPANITQNTDAGVCGAILNWTVPIATDNCSVSLSSSHHPGDFFNVGTTTVTYTALDTHGNSTFETFEIIVEDKNGPDFVSCPSLFIVESIDAISKKAIISWIEPTATEPCSYFTMSSNYKPGDSFSFGVTTIIYTATDGHGNESTCSFDVESGINNPPSIKSQYLSSKAGESINICLSSEDPDGDQVKIKTIRVNGEHATIEDVDSLALCFIYTSFKNFGGIDTVLVEIIDDGLPDMSAFTEVVIEVEREKNIYPSSALTPNGDGSNDIWIIKNIDLYSDNSVSIYDRWGSLIYNKTGYNNIRNVWDGSNTNGAIVPTGTYFYVINLDNDENITGPIEVIR